MKRSHLLSRLFALLAVASLVLGACAPAVTQTPAPPPTQPQQQATQPPAPTPVPATTAPPKLKSVTGAWSQEPDKVTPYFTVMSYALWIAQLTLAGLAEWDDKGNLVPELAADVPTTANGGVSPDGLTITWKLKPGLKWSDGAPLTSADVVFTYEAIMDEANVVTQRSAYESIASVEAPDDLTVVIKFKEVYPPWQILFTQGPNNAGAILPKHILQGKKALESDPFIRMPTVGSGPFVITEWIPGDRMLLVANENFHKGRPKLDQINIKFVPDPETALAALQTGDVDWYPDFSESDIATLLQLESEGKLKSLVVPGPDFEHYFFNLGTTAGVEGWPNSKSDVDGFCPFKDIRVRKAIIYGIDRQAIVDSLLEGKTIVPASQWPNSAWTNTSLQPEPYDPEKAKALLDEAGYKPGPDGIRVGKCDGKDVKLSFNFETTTKQIRVDIALAAQSDLRKIGIEFKPIHTPAGTFFGTYTDGGPLPTGKYDMAGYTTGFYPDPYPTAGDWDCNIPSKDNPSGTNVYHICDPKLVELLKAVNATADPAARKVALDAVQKYIYDQAYVVMMYARANVYGFTPRFQYAPFGFISNLNWNAELWDVTD
jgi:peptide/nickel transport system substrate-binding protein